MWCSALFLLFIPFVGCTLQFTSLGSLKLYNASNKGEILQDGATRSAYHKPSRMLYVIGTSTKVLHIVDLTIPNNPQLKYKHHFNDPNGGHLTDIAVCDNIFAVSLTDKDIIDAGHVLFYNTYIDGDNSLTTVKPSQAVGPYPKRIAFCSDCKRLLVANEGRPGPNPSTSNFQDPEGSITIIKNIQDSFSSRTTTRTETFVNFNQTLYTGKGVRYIYHDSKFHEDLEPDAVTIDDNDHFAFISLQENNAIVRYDLTSEKIVDIYPMGFKNWNNYDMDASDVDIDDGVAQMKRHDIRSFYQPGAMKYLNISNKGYLLTANTGAVKHYTNGVESVEFTEAGRSKILIESNEDYFFLTNALKTKMRDDNELGRLYISKIDGKNPDNRINQLYTYGGRSITLWDSTNISSVYDSGQSMEEEALKASLTKFTANGDCSDIKKSPLDEADKRSDDHGVEPTAVDAGDFEDRKVVVVGTRTSQLYLYSLSGTSLFFQSIYMNRPGANTSPWENLYKANITGTAIITDVKYFDKETSPDRLPMVIVISSGTSSLETLRVYDDGIFRK